jgi:hypothetical protein
VIFNAYAVLDAFVSLLRVGLGLLVVWQGLAAWALWRGATLESRTALEERYYLLFAAAAVLLALNVLSWPLFDLLLQSYVPEWPGAMCIYGVTRIGLGSRGVSRFLPPLVTGLEAVKPALVFLSGAWFVLHLANKRTRTAPLTGRVLALLLATGLLAVGDAAAELAYLVIPKKEEFLSAGCCTEALLLAGHDSRFLPSMLFDESATPWLWAGYFAANLGLLAALRGYDWFGRRSASRGWLAALFGLATLTAAVNGVFLVEVAAPRLLHLPFHHCPYDLVPRAPDSVAAAALFVAGDFAVGWACLAGCLGRHAETRQTLPGQVGRLLDLGFIFCAGSLIMMSLELALA